MDMDEDRAHFDIRVTRQGADRKYMAKGVKLNGIELPLCRDIRVVYGLNEPAVVQLEFLSTGITEVIDE